MMKTRLETNIYGYLLRLVVLFKLAYSDGVDLILSCWNSNEESGPGFSVFSVFQAKGAFEAKTAKLVYLQLLIKHDWKGIWQSSWAHFEAWGLKIIIKSKTDILPMMPCKKFTLNFNKWYFEEN